MQAKVEEKIQQDSTEHTNETPIEYKEAKQKEILGMHSINTPPEMAQYRLKYDETDIKLEQYLSEKYKDDIDKFQYFPDDIIVRFVLGYKHIGDDNYDQRLQETDKWFSKYLIFHEKTDYDNLTTKLSKQELAELAPATFIYGNDKYGHPVLYDDGRRYRKNGDLSIFRNKDGDADYDKMDLFIGFCIRKLHEVKLLNTKRYKLLDDQKNENPDKYKKRKIGIYQHCAVIDMKDFSVTKCLYERKINEYMTRRGAELSPEMLHKMYFLNVPWLFCKVWNIFKNFLHPVTVEKTIILGSDYIDELKKDIDINMIPKEYGGNGKWGIKYGDVPDGFYD